MLSDTRDKFIRARVSEAEQRAIMAAARRQDLTVSQLIRHALRRARGATHAAAQ